MGKPHKHKRKKPKSGRRGCLLCKPHKHQRAKGGLKARAKRLWKRDIDGE